jgi:hypothetical protein
VPPPLFGPGERLALRELLGAGEVAEVREGVRLAFAANVAGGAASRAVAAAAVAFLAPAEAAFDGLGFAAAGLPARGLAAAAA